MVVLNLNVGIFSGFSYWSVGIFLVVSPVKIVAVAEILDAFARIMLRGLVAFAEILDGFARIMLQTSLTSVTASRAGLVMLGYVI
jgi:hypothetical protein